LLSKNTENGKENKQKTYQPYFIAWSATSRLEWVRVHNMDMD